MKKKPTGEPKPNQEEGFVTWCGGIEPRIISCGGIKPIDIFEENEDEMTECTEQF